MQVPDARIVTVMPPASDTLPRLLTIRNKLLCGRLSLKGNRRSHQSLFLYIPAGMPFFRCRQYQFL